MSSTFYLRDVTNIEELVQLSLVFPDFMMDCEEKSKHVDKWVHDNISWLIQYITFDEDSIQFNENLHRRSLQFNIFDSSWYARYDDPFYDEILTLYNRVTGK